MAEPKRTKASAYGTIDPLNKWVFIMSQVRIGTVDVTNGSQAVTGSGTNWLSSVSANDLFIIQGESVIYRIASVASDTQLSLSSNYVGVTATALPYVVHIDFTTSGIPLMQDGDIETVSIYNLAVISLEQGLSFGTYYLGAFAAAPTSTGTGGAITEGMMYFDTVTDLLRVYDGSAWYDGAASANAAAQSAAEAAADAILTAADRVQTGLDRVQTTSDRIQTISDAAQTASDRAQTGLDSTQTGIDAAQTVSDAILTAADRVQTGLDAVDTAADAVQTGSDRTQTTADASQTASDRVQTGLDSTQTASDRVQTVADAAQTAGDRVQTSADRVQTISDAASTAADRTYVDGVEANVAAIEVSINNTFDTFDDRFLGTFTTDPTHDNDGNAISVGAVYYNSVELATKFYNGSTWDDPSQSASTSATNALNSENAAALSETNAATSESNAATSETNAAASESAASTSEGNAATSASASSSSATASSNSATAAAASYDSFDDRYLGPKASDPTLDNDGSALLSGAMYWSTSEDVMKVYTGSLWKLVSTVVEGVYQVTEFTNIATQTTLTITYDVGLAQVLYNGVQLNFSDFTATNGTTIVLASPVALADDVITVILWGAVTSSSLVGTAAALDTGTAAGELPTNADLATGAFTTVGTAATKNTGVTTGTLPFAEDVVLVDASGNANVNGILTADGLTVDGVSTDVATFNGASGFVTDVTIKAPGPNSNMGLVLTESGATTNKSWKIGSNVAINGNLEFIPSTTAGGSTFSTPAISVTPTGNFGIGTSSPSRTLELKAAVPSIRLTDTNADDYGEILVVDGSLIIRADEGNTAAGSYIRLEVDGSEKMRLDSSGNLLVGKTAPDAAVAGSELKADGTAVFSRSSTSPTMYVSTLGSDGDLISFRKDSTAVGSIGVVSGSNFYINNGDTGLCFRPSAADIVPVSSGGSGRDAAIDIGDPSFRFKDLYLSGGVYLGGTGADNKLDDYEEGLWTPVFSNVGTSVGSYTKVGNMVTCWIRIETSATGASGNSFGGLPFIIYNSIDNRGSGVVGYQNSNLSETMTILTNGSSSYGFTLRIANIVQELLAGTVAWATFSYMTNS